MYISSNMNRLNANVSYVCRFGEMHILYLILFVYAVAQQADHDKQLADGWTEGRDRYNTSVIGMSFGVYLQLFILQQSDDQTPDITHSLLIIQEGEQVVEDHDLQVGEHRVARMPGAALRDLHARATPAVSWRCFRFKTEGQDRHQDRQRGSDAYAG